MPELNKQIGQMLGKYSEVQMLRAILNSYRAIDELKPGQNQQPQTVVFKSSVVATSFAVKMDEPISNLLEPEEPDAVPTSDHPPCGTCGGNFFLRTGTCHVCQICGASQGCS
jgi:hypothetical protein